MKTTDSESYILFELAGTSYAVPSREVLHMEMVEHITPVPNAPSFVEGVVFSRGQVIPAVNLRLRFGFPRQEHDLRTRLLVVQAAERAVGLIVDSAREFRVIPRDTLQQPDSTLQGLSGKFLAAIASLDDRLVLVLDLAATLNQIEQAGTPQEVPVPPQQAFTQNRYEKENLAGQPNR